MLAIIKPGMLDWLGNDVAKQCGSFSKGVAAFQRDPWISMEVFCFNLVGFKKFSYQRKALNRLAVLVWQRPKKDVL